MTSSWKSIRLADAGKWLSGGTPKTSEPGYWDGDIPWISAKSLTKFRVRESDRKVTELGSKNGTRLVPAGSILLVVRGMSLKTEFRMGITQRQVAFGQDCKAILPAPGVDPEYLAYAIRAKTAEILDLVDEAGHGTGRLQMDLLSNVEIPLPEVDEQRAIAAVLSLHDDKLDSINRANGLAEEILDCVAARIGEELPDVALSELAVPVRTTVNPKSYGEDTVSHFSIPAFDDGGRPERGPASAIMSNKLLIERPAVLVSRLNPRFDRTWWVTPEDGIPAFASPEFLALTASDAVELARIWLAVRAPSFRTEVRARVTGTSGSHQRIRPDDMLSIPVPDVRQVDAQTLELAHRLLVARAQRVSDADALIRLRDFLIGELFDGTLAVTDELEANA